MKKICILFFLLMLFCKSVSAQLSEEKSLSKFSWLEGKWERVMNNPNQSGFEEWERSEDSLTGRGVTIQQGDTVFVEKLFIEMKNDDWYYVADVSQNTEPTYFKIIEIYDAGFASENPEHDFPKKIEYQLSDNGELNVIISGDDRSVPFTFHKKNE